MKFSVIKHDNNPLRDKIAESFIKKCIQHGHELSPPENGVKFVLNLTGIDNPQFFRRNTKNIFVFSLITADTNGKNLHSLCYTTLVHTLSNVLLCAVPADNSITGSDCEIYFTTPEAGFYHFPFDPEKVYQQLLPLASARFAIGNTFSTDLPQQYWKTTPIVEKLKKFGGVMDSLGILPSPFPLKKVLPKESIQHLYKLFEMKGLSYGNLSARESIPELSKTTFWMTARGINKARLSKVGTDILLVKGFDMKQGKALVSVPPVYELKARVSVDAVEHEMIYRTFPDVGAIVHVHAWMKGVLCTRQNYPCGTQELAEEVVRLLKQTNNPARTAVGLKNHGLTITGPSLDEIFERISSKLIIQVPMFA
ncbi:MAG: class II aldolase/adducin family protein [Candidatus Aminicenantes bacterium]|nr:class II aldolase/adducin family protein [Candidatus Aminicenantes bacterium]